MADARPNPDADSAADDDDAGDDQPAPPAPSSSRQQRNKAEKQRRDKLNNFITELATLVPTVSSSPKRLDKTSILRLSANFLRTSRCSVLNPSDNVDRDTGRFFAHLNEVLQSLDGFLLVVDGTGKILIVTDTVEKMLGHSQNDMLGHTLFSFTSPEQHAELRRHLTPDGQPTAPAPAPTTSSAVSPGGASGDDSMSSADSASSALSSPPPAPQPPPSASTSTASAASPAGSAGSPAASEASGGGGSTTSGGGGGSDSQRQRRSFVLSLSQRAVSRGDAVNYEPVSVLGYLHVPASPPPPAGPRHGRKQREPPAPSASDIVLVAVVLQHREKRVSEYSLLEASHEEYVTRHFQDGRIAYSDHRIAMVAGYMADEVSGRSAFDFMHREDVNFTVVALQQMYDLSQGAGGSAYRLRAKTGRYIYLRTQGFLEYQRHAKEMTTLICINTLLTEEEGERMIQEMKARYAASISKCFQITQTGGPLASAVTPEYIPQIPAVMPAPEPLALPSPVQVEEHRFVQPSPASDSALSPNQGTSPGSAQFANMALYSPPPPPAPVQPQISPPNARYPSVITGPNSVPTSMDRPTVLRTSSVITERVSVLTTAGCPSETPMDTGSCVDTTERSHWGYKEVSVLKRTFSLDADATSSKRLHTGAPRPARQRRRDSQPTSATEGDEGVREVEMPHGAPVLSPEEQHQALIARGVPGHVPSYRGTWPDVPGQMSLTQTPLPDLSSSCLQMSLHSAAVISSPAIPCEPDPDSPASLGDLRTDDLLSLDDGADCIKEALQVCLDAPSSVETECAAWLDFAEVPGHELGISAPGVESAAIQAYKCVDQELERQHQQLQSRMALQETQMSRLEQHLEAVPTISDEPLRSTLTQLQAQHKKQRQMLHTLKQDHHCLQRQDKLAPGPCVKQNLGV